MASILIAVNTHYSACKSYSLPVGLTLLFSPCWLAQSPDAHKETAFPTKTDYPFFHGLFKWREIPDWFMDLSHYMRITKSLVYTLMIKAASPKTFAPFAKKKRKLTIMHDGLSRLRVSVILKKTSCRNRPRTNEMVSVNNNKVSRWSEI